MNAAAALLRVAAVAADAMAAQSRRQRLLKLLESAMHQPVPADIIHPLRVALRLADEAIELTWRVLAANFEAANDARYVEA